MVACLEEMFVLLDRHKRKCHRKRERSADVFRLAQNKCGRLRAYALHDFGDVDRRREQRLCAVEAAREYSRQIEHNIG